MEALDLLLGFPLEDGSAWGACAAPFQLEDARTILEGLRPYSYIVRSRGSSKTTDLAGCALALALTAPERSRFYWCASDVEQAGLALDVIGGFCARSDALADALELQSRRVVVRASGTTLEALPADAASAFGLKPSAVFIDEIAAWPDTENARRFLDALTTSVLKVAGARMAILTAAGSPSHPAYRLLQHARGDALWTALERVGPAPWTPEDRLAEQRRRLPASVYEQLFEARWTEVEGSFLDEGMVDAAFVLGGPGLRRLERTRYVGALDLGHVNDRSVFCVGHLEGETVVLDSMTTWAGSKARPVSFSEVELAILAAYERYRCDVVADPWQALHVAERLRARGVPVREVAFSPAYKQRLASTLLQAMADGVLALYEADGLRDELRALRLKAGTAGSWTFDHAAGGHDDRAVALSMMLVAALGERGGGDAIQYCGFCLREGCDSIDCDGAPVVERGGMVLRGARYVDLPAQRD